MNVNETIDCKRKLFENIHEPIKNLSRLNKNVWELKKMKRTESRTIKHRNDELANVKMTINVMEESSI